MSKMLHFWINDREDLNYIGYVGVRDGITLCQICYEVDIDAYIYCVIKQMNERH